MNPNKSGCHRLRVRATETGPIGPGKKLTSVGLAAALFVGILTSSIPEVRAEPTRVGVYRGLQCALIYLADMRGLFKKHGTDVTIGEYEAGVLAVNDLVAGKVDVAAASEFVFVGQSLSRPDIRTPATICSGSDIEIVVRSDHGIRGPQDLKGKSVAVLRGSGAEFFLYYYLIFSNISPGDVRIVDLKPSQMVQELAAGSIDAAVFGEPYTTDMARRLPGKAVRWSAQNGQDYYFLLIVKDEFRKKRPAQIEQLLAALLEAEQFVSRYPDQAKALLRQRLGTDAAPFVSAWSHMRHRVQLTQDLVVLMEEEAKWVVRNKRTEAIEIPNYLDYLSFGALEKLKPEAVSIVH